MQNVNKNLTLKPISKYINITYKCIHNILPASLKSVYFRKLPQRELHFFYSYICFDSRAQYPLVIDFIQQIVALALVEK